MAVASFRHTIDRHVPKMAWCARLRRGDPVVHVRHGSWVEQGVGFFFEGAWNGPFGAGAFTDATICLGSGARLTRDGSVEFAGASHPKERLHFLRDGDLLYVSNSLPFVLAEAGDELDWQYRFLQQDLISFCDGLESSVDGVPTALGNTVKIVYCSNISVGPELQLRKELKPEPRRFSDYADYVAFLRTEVARLHANADRSGAADSVPPGRDHRPSGYDSPAAAILAREIGCTEAVTFVSGRENFGEDSDSGTEIGRLLGMTVHEFHRTAYRSSPNVPEAEFLAVGTGGEDVPMSVFEERIEGTLFFTGFLGDRLWARLWPDPRGSERFEMGPDGASLSEFRLRVGFVHLPIPLLLSFTRHPDLHRIANSAEMRPWRSPNPLYDRPVPRRFIEENGVPRGMFGKPNGR